MRRISALAAIAASAVLVLSGCSSTDSSSSPTTTDAAGTTADAPAVASTTETTVAEATSEAETTTTSAAATPAIMPNVVCMNLQAAQDKIQEAGVFYSRSNDATGAGRRQLIDSNWVVVSQTPAAGSEVGEGEAVLSAVKIGEPGSCIP